MHRRAMIPARLAMVLVLALCAGSPLRAQDSSDPELLKSRVLTAFRRATLTSSAMQPYRLRAHITAYDGAGKNHNEGSLEILHRGRESRVTVTFPTGTAVALGTVKGAYIIDPGTLPYYSVKLVKAFQQPAVFEGFDATAAPFERAPFQCISLTDSSHAIVTGPHPPPHAACLQKTEDVLRVLIDGEEIYLRDDIEEVDRHDLARHFQLQLGAFVVAELKVESFENTAVTDDELAVSPRMKPLRESGQPIAAEVIAGRLLKHDPPKYPGAAKVAHIQGVVVLQAIIDITGHTTNITVVSSPDPLLSKSAIEAVSKWVYEPYLLNGKPTAIDTTISLNFAIGR